MWIFADVWCVRVGGFKSIMCRSCSNFCSLGIAFGIGVMPLRLVPRGKLSERCYTAAFEFYWWGHQVGFFPRFLTQDNEVVGEELEFFRTCCGLACEAAYISFNLGGKTPARVRRKLWWSLSGVISLARSCQL